MTLPDYTYELVPEDMVVPTPRCQQPDGECGPRCIWCWSVAAFTRGRDRERAEKEIGRALGAKRGDVFFRIEDVADTRTLAGAWNRAMRALGYDISDAGCRLGE